MNVEQVTVIGAGTMGNGIAHCMAQYGHTTTLYDLNRKLLDKAFVVINNNMDRQIQKGILTAQQKEASLNRIQLTTDSAKAYSQADLIIEAVSEKIEVKKSVLNEVIQYKPSHCLVASNTSSLSITALAAHLPFPEQYAGMHFMNPVPMMPLVEIIAGFHTAKETVKTLQIISKKIGKTPIVVQDSPGFVANRIVLPMINEAIETLQQNISGVREIDQIMKLGMGHPMGPLQLADFIGLDVCLAILEVLHEELGQDKYAPAPLLRKMVVAKQLGKKSGIGFYNYQTDSKNPPVAHQFQ